MSTEPGMWFTDRIAPDFVQMHGVREMLYTGHSRFQEIQVIATSRFGKCLVLDGKIQSTEVDEFIYHEALVQPAMITHPAPETVFIAGGGEGATLREVLAHNSVKRAVMIDIDEEVVAVCKRFLPGHSRGAFDDGRTLLHHVDARDYLAKSSEAFDVVIVDLPDPIEEGPAYLLYTREFYELVRARLTHNGVISVQSGSASLTELLNLSSVYQTLKSTFPVVRAFQTDVPSFGGPWGFCLASASLDAARLPVGEVDGRISARSLHHLRFYDGLTHQAMFSLPKYLRNTLAQPAMIITDRDPLYAYTGQPRKYPGSSAAAT